MNINDLYPEENTIPEQFRIDYIKQTEYLINGEIREWRGEFMEFSPLFA